MTHWDETEFASIFAAIHPGLLRYLECSLGHSGAAQDIAQEAFVRLYRLGPGRIRPGEERFWLYRVSSNLARNAPISRKSPVQTQLPPQRTSPKHARSSIATPDACGAFD